MWRHAPLDTRRLPPEERMKEKEARQSRWLNLAAARFPRPVAGSWGPFGRGQNALTPKATWSTAQTNYEWRDGCRETAARGEIRSKTGVYSGENVRKGRWRGETGGGGWMLEYQTFKRQKSNIHWSKRSDSESFEWVSDYDERFLEYAALNCISAWDAKGPHTPHYRVLLYRQDGVKLTRAHTRTVNRRAACTAAVKNKFFFKPRLEVTGVRRGFYCRATTQLIGKPVNRSLVSNTFGEWWIVSAKNAKLSPVPISFQLLESEDLLLLYPLYIIVTWIC